MACWWATILVCWGQFSSSDTTLPGFGLPLAPDSRILDEAGLLDNHPEAVARISARLKRLDADHDLPTYLVIYSALVMGNVAQLPRDIYDAWIGEGNEGVVVVCEIDSRNMKIAFPVDGGRSPASREKGMTRLPDHRLIPLINAVNKETEGVTNKVEYLDRLTATLATELNGLLRVRKEKAADTGRFVTVTLVIGALIGVLGYFGHRFMSRLEAKSHEQLYFPDVEVSPRLGAPYGGARVNTLAFQLSERAGDGEES